MVCRVAALSEVRPTHEIEVGLTLRPNLQGIVPGQGRTRRNGVGRSKLEVAGVRRWFQRALGPLGPGDPPLLDRSQLYATELRLCPDGREGRGQSRENESQGHYGVAGGSIEQLTGGYPCAP